MSCYEEFRRRAEEAQNWADRAKTEADRANWQRVADGWLSLSRPHTAAAAFEAECRAKGTGQLESRAIH